jgi:hypothetical protein
MWGDLHGDPWWKLGLGDIIHTALFLAFDHLPFKAQPNLTQCPVHFLWTRKKKLDASTQL